MPTLTKPKRPLSAIQELPHTIVNPVTNSIKFCCGGKVVAFYQQDGAFYIYPACAEIYRNDLICLVNRYIPELKIDLTTITLGRSHMYLTATSHPKEIKYI